MTASLGTILAPSSSLHHLPYAYKHSLGTTSTPQQPTSHLFSSPVATTLAACGLFHGPRNHASQPSFIS